MPGGTVSRVARVENHNNNNTVGVHKLPYELLSEIFVLRLSSLDLSACETQPSCLKDLTSVCSFWRDIALSMTFVTEIDIHLSATNKRNKRNLKSTKDGLSAYLDRSKDASISLTVHIVDNLYCKVTGVDTDVWTMAMLHSARYCSITFRAHYAEHLELVLPLRGHLPRLQKVAFDIRQSHGSAFPDIFDINVSEMQFQLGSSLVKHALRFRILPVLPINPERPALTQDYQAVQSIANCRDVEMVSFKFKFDTPRESHPWIRPALPVFLSQSPARVILEEMRLGSYWGKNTVLPRFPSLPITALTLQYPMSLTDQALSLLFRSCPILKKLTVRGGSIAEVTLRVLADNTRAQPVLKRLQKLEIFSSRFSTRYKAAALADLLENRLGLYVVFDTTSFVLSDMGNPSARVLESKYPQRFIRLLS